MEMNDSMERQRALEVMRKRWWWLLGSSVLVIGIPLAGFSLFPETSFWISMLATVLAVFAVALMAFVIRHRKALALLLLSDNARALDDEYGRDSIQRGSTLAYVVTASMLFIMPLTHYYLIPLSVSVACWVPLMCGAAVQAFYIHRRLS